MLGNPPSYWPQCHCFVREWGPVRFHFLSMGCADSRISAVIQPRVYCLVIATKTVTAGPGRWKSDKPLPVTECLITVFCITEVEKMKGLGSHEGRKLYSQ